MWFHCQNWNTPCCYTCIYAHAYDLKFKIHYGIIPIGLILLLLSSIRSIPTLLPGSAAFLSCFSCFKFHVLQETRNVPLDVRKVLLEVFTYCIHKASAAAAWSLKRAVEIWWSRIHSSWKGYTLTDIIFLYFFSIRYSISKPLLLYDMHSQPQSRLW